MFDVALTAHSTQPVPATRDPLAPTIFHEAWLLEAATAGQYEVVEALQDGVVVGRLAFTRRRGCGITLINQPRLTHLLGPAIDEGSGGPTTRAARRNRIVRELLAKLPASSGFSQKIQGGISEALPFQEAGYEIGVEITYELPPAPEAELWRRMRDKTRNVIRRAQEQLDVGGIGDVSEFLGFYQANLDERDQRSFYAQGHMDAVCRAAVAQDRGRILGARDRAGRLVAAILVLHDDRAAYYFMSTRRRDGHNGAISLLLWTAIRQANALGLTFDFDGFCSTGVGAFYLGFGGRAAARFIVSRSSPALRMLKAAKGVADQVRRGLDEASGQLAQWRAAPGWLPARAAPVPGAITQPATTHSLITMDRPLAHDGSGRAPPP